MALPTRIAPAPGDTTTSHASWLMLAVLLLGQFMCIIDVLVTNVAMPSIAASLHPPGPLVSSRFVSPTRRSRRRTS